MTSAAPPGFRTVTPYVIVEKAPELADFIKQAFGAEETRRARGSAGGFHIELRIGDSVIMVGGGGEWKGTPRPTALHVYVPDVDAAYQRAIAAGAESVRKPADQEYGDRDCAVKDFAGNEWFLATHKGDSYVYPGLTTVTPYLHPANCNEYILFMMRAFAAQVVESYVDPEGGENRVLHAKLRIEDSIIECGEAHGPWQNKPTSFMLYVDIADFWYARALRGEAVPVSPPADLPFGRSGTVRDGWDNHYYITTART